MSNRKRIAVAVALVTVVALLGAAAFWLLHEREVRQAAPESAQFADRVAIKVVNGRISERPLPFFTDNGGGASTEVVDRFVREHLTDPLALKAWWLCSAELKATADLDRA